MVQLRDTLGGGNFYGLVRNGGDRHLCEKGFVRRADVHAPHHEIRLDEHLSDGIAPGVGMPVIEQKRTLFADIPYPVGQPPRSRLLNPDIARITVSISFFGPPSAANVRTRIASRSSTCAPTGSSLPTISIAPWAP